MSDLDRNLVRARQLSPCEIAAANDHWYGCLDDEYAILCETCKRAEEIAAALRAAYQQGRDDRKCAELGYTYRGIRVVVDESVPLGTIEFWHPDGRKSRTEI